MKVVIIIFVFLCASDEIKSSRWDLKRLQSKVDFFLDTILDINHNIRELREIVDNLDNQNATCACDLQHGNVSPEAVDENTSYHAGSAELFIEEFESKMAAVQRGFREEKSSIRKIVEQQGKSINDIARNVNDSKTELHAEITQHLDETVKAVTNVSEALNKHRDVVSSGFTRLSDKLDNVNATCERHVKDIESEVKNLKSDVTQVSNKIQDMSSLIRLLFVLQADVNYKAFGTSVYKYHTETLTWIEAQQKCQEDGFHLAEINDDDEHEFIKKLVGSNLAWLGSTDVDKEGDWRWVSSGLKVMASLWNTGEPNNYGNQEHCLHTDYGITSDGLNDRNCEDGIAFVCELEP